MTDTGASRDKLRETLIRSAREIERLRGLLAAAESGNHRAREPIAIVGVGLELPGGAHDLDSLWALLEAGTDAVGPVPAERWNADAVYDPDPDAEGKSYVRQGAFLREVERFDADFFGITPREAREMDPQHRLVLEAAWHALEDAALVPGALEDSLTGVFVGVGPSEYQLLSPERSLADGAYHVTGTHTSFAAGRLAYTLGLQGPALSVDTACSSSLVALHLACQSLRRGECELALAAGVQVMAAPDSFVLLSRTRALAPDGRSKTFSALADGYGRGEGVVALALQRLADAQAQGRRIHAVIRGSAVNHDGKSSGITAPNGSSQQKVLRAALKDAGLEPTDVDVVECHGTGTALGDPIEVQALAAVYGSERPHHQPLRLGALKTNIGHLECASGLAGVAKILAALRHSALPATLHSTPRNPHVDWESMPVRVVDALESWTSGRNGAPRRAGISAFGLAGTNAHVILEEAPAMMPGVASDARKDARIHPPSHLVLLSARDEDSLRAGARRLHAHVHVHVQAHPEATVDDIAVSLATGRSHFARRAVIQAHSWDELLERLDNMAAERSGPIEPAERAPKLAFLFSGQGAQRPGMGKELYRLHPVFRDALDQCAALLDAHIERPLLPVLFADEGTAESQLLHRTRYTQPALFALEYALFRLLSAWGIEPDAVLGHSVGEITAACAAGALSLEDACRLIAVRGALMDSLPEGGAMASVAMADEELLPLLTGREDRLAAAAFNAPNQIVVSGAEAALAELLAELSARGIRTRRLAVSHAFHSPLLEPMLGALRRACMDIQHQAPRITWISNLTGAPVQSSLLHADYWVRHARQPVRFAEGVKALRQVGISGFVEIGPDPVLCGLAASCFADDEQPIFVPTLRKGRSEWNAVTAALGQLYVRGCEIAWPAFFAPLSGHRIELPGYAFSGRRFWRGVATETRPPAPRSEPAAAVAKEALSESTSELLQQLRNADARARRHMLIERIQGEVDRVLGMPAGEHAPVARGFFESGMDSLMALELRNRLQRSLGVPLPHTVVFERPTIIALVEYVLEEVLAPMHAPVSVVTAPREHKESDLDSAIAIVGMACRFPGGANDPEAYWRLLREGTEAVGDIPPERWDRNAYYDPAPTAVGKMYSARCGFLANWPVDSFDAEFFGIAPAEARSLDPQHRLLLELSWEALEHAGIPVDGPEKRPALTRTGVFIGLVTSDYTQIVMRGGLSKTDAYQATGVTFHTAAGRISHVLGLQGPNLALDTACSSSLVALHLACRSLRSGESDMALVGGVNLMLTPWIQILYSRMGGLSPSGRCRAFDAQADGMVRGEGGGMVVLERYRDAVRHGDRVLAIIRGSAVNHDGRASGLTVPNGQAQRDVLRAAMADARVSPDQIQYIEAHGTGTPVGDPIEVNALVAELGKERGAGQPLYLGSAKSNIGHLEAAAGMAGLMKAMLAMRHGTLAPQPHFQTLNPNVETGACPVVVPTQAMPWPDSEGPRLSGISSFGVSGTNAHVIIETPAAAPDAGSAGELSAAPEPNGESAWLLPISAKHPVALRELAGRYRELFTTRADIPVAEICRAAALRRTHLEERLAVVGSSRAELIEALDAYYEGKVHPRCIHGVADPGRTPRIAFVFSGFGGAWPAVGRTLLGRDTAFREALAACDRALSRAELPFSVMEELASEPAPALGDRRSRVEVVQPLLFAVQVAAVASWRSRGIEPDAVIGHSVGEVAAAWAAGALTLDDAARLVVRRSAIVARAQGQGGMAVVALPLDRAQALVAKTGGRVSVSACNSPRMTVIAGEHEAVAELVAALGRHNVFARMVEGAGAGHSPQMEPYLPELREGLRGMRPSPPGLPFYSTVTGASYTEALDAGYWMRNLREPVLFAQAVAAMGQDGFGVFVELSPEPLLLTSIEQTLRPGGGAITLASTLEPEKSDSLALLTGLARLHVAGAPVHWQVALGAPSGPMIDLPSYPWQRKRHWWPYADEQASQPEGRAQATEVRAVAQPDGQTAVLVLGADEPSETASREDVRRSVAERLDDWRYELAWQPAPLALPRQAAAEAGGRKPGLWLLLADREGVAAGLADVLRGRGQEAILVTPGDQASVHFGPGEPWCMSPAHAENAAKVLESARERGPLLGVIHLWGVDAQNPLGETEMCASLVHFVQAMVGEPSFDAGDARLWIITRGAQPAGTHSRVTNPGGATLWGIGKALTLEHPERFGRLIDLDPDAEERGDNLVQELDASDPEEFVAWRQGQRLTLRLLRAGEPAVPETPIRFRAEVVYLITGGLGGTGIALARWMVDRGARRLILTSRRGLPARHSMNPPEADYPDAALIEQVRELEARGATIWTEAMDVTSREDVSAILGRLDDEGTALGGIFHLAGTTRPQPLVATSMDDLREVLGPKVTGTRNLHELTRERNLDWFVCFSSTAAVWGSATLGSYAAANIYLDALAHHRRALGLRATTINWGGLRGGGMLDEALMRMFAQMGFGFMSLDEAFEAMDAVLQSSAVQKTILQADWSRFRPIYEARKRRPLFDELKSGAPEAGADIAGVSERGVFLRALSLAEERHRWSLLLDHIQAVAAEVLGFGNPGELDRRRGFFQLGMDSMMSVQLRGRLEVSLACPLPPTLAFEHPTVNELASYLAADVLAGTCEIVLPSAFRANASLEDECRSSSPAPAQDDLDALSVDALAALLAAELGTGNQGEVDA